MIDEYPSMRHSGVGMGMRRPIEVFKEVNEIRGCFTPLDPNLRRIHLGFKQTATPTDEGVRVLSGLWFNSDELHACLDERPVSGKVDVFLDPDNLSAATVLLPRVQKTIEVRIQITAFADLTAAEMLELIAVWKSEDPRSTELHEDQIYRIRRERGNRLRAIGLEHNLKRSYVPLPELEAKAGHLMAGARVVPDRPLSGTTAPGSITDLTGSRAIIHRTGRPDMLVDGRSTHDAPTNTTASCVAAPEDIDARPDRGEQSVAASPQSNRARSAGGGETPVLGRPSSVKRLE